MKKNLNSNDCYTITIILLDFARLMNYFIIIFPTMIGTLNITWLFKNVSNGDGPRFCFSCTRVNGARTSNTFSLQYYLRLTTRFRLRLVADFIWEEKNKLNLEAMANKMRSKNPPEKKTPPVQVKSKLPPDGGWGWFVVFGSFMIHVVSEWFLIISQIIFIDRIIIIIDNFTVWNKYVQKINTRDNILICLRFNILF